jgi:hypothetical protein
MILGDKTRVKHSNDAPKVSLSQRCPFDGWKGLVEYKGVDALRSDTFNKTFYQNVSARQPFTQLTRFRVKY